MTTIRKRLLLPILLLALIATPALAQSGSDAIDKAALWAGKTGTVVMVLATIFAGILIFLIILERQIRRMEKER